jgi:hypothetical protein
MTTFTFPEICLGSWLKSSASSVRTNIPRVMSVMTFLKSLAIPTAKVSLHRTQRQRDHESRNHSKRRETAFCA